MNVLRLIQKQNIMDFLPSLTPLKFRLSTNLAPVVLFALQIALLGGLNLLITV